MSRADDCWSGCDGVGGGVVVVARRSKTITGKITQLLHGGVGGGQRQIVSRNAFHDYCGTNVSTHTPTHPPTTQGLPADTVYTLPHIHTGTRETATLSESEEKS